MLLESIIKNYKAFPITLQQKPYFKKLSLNHKKAYFILQALKKQQSSACNSNTILQFQPNKL